MTNKVKMIDINAGAVIRKGFFAVFRISGLPEAF
jgi:hypothetical protein